MRLSDSGRLAMAVWEGLPSHYPHIQLDTYVIMPNHVHGIVVLEDKDDRHVGAGFKPFAPTNSHFRYNLRAQKTYQRVEVNAIQRDSDKLPAHKRGLGVIKHPIGR